jgi:glycine/D-amino acid oxidase-like deaminating enzyme
MANFARRKFLKGAGLGLGAVAGYGGYRLKGPGGAIVPGTSRAQPVLGDARPPSQADVVVIGGGFIGCSTALCLAERKISVVLCEKGVIAGEASGRSVGAVDGSYADPLKLPLIARSKELWAQMNARVGADSGFRPSGSLNLCTTPNELAASESWLASVRGRPEADGRMLSRSEIARLVPLSNIAWLGGLYEPSNASVEPQLAAPAIATAARRLGAQIVQQCAVRGIETKAGRVDAVVTEHGRIMTNAVVLAGGVWSPVFASSLGLPLPQFQAFSSMISVAPLAGPDVITGGNGVMYRRQPDGGYYVCAINGAAPITPTTLRYGVQLIPTLRNLWEQLDPVFSPSTFLREWNTPRHWPLDQASPFESIRILQPEVRVAKLAEVFDTAKSTYPFLARAQIRERWAGALVNTLDNMPVLSAVVSHPGLYFGTGFYFGLTMGPAAGEALADLVTGAKPKIDLYPYRYARFIDGTKLEFRA